MSARIPYGYKIVNGQAEPYSEQVKKIQCFFDCYLEGYSLRKATVVAGVERSWMSCRNMLVNPVYLGTEDYPPIFTPEQMERAAGEVKRRGAHLTGKTGRPVRKPFPIQTEFFYHKEADWDKEADREGETPADISARMYRSICSLSDGRNIADKQNGGR